MPATTLDALAEVKAKVMVLLNDARKPDPDVFDPVRSGKVLAYEAVMIRIDEAMTAARLAE
ncbi:MAG: hypothetical protein M3Y26_01325 [Actinomycetota bacterium]|nr:hypothetical protein [Actinomycetota bacterium]